MTEPCHSCGTPTPPGDLAPHPVTGGWYCASCWLIVDDLADRPPYIPETPRQYAAVAAYKRIAAAADYMTDAELADLANRELHALAEHYRQPDDEENTP